MLVGNPDREPEQVWNEQRCRKQLPQHRTSGAVATDTTHNSFSRICALYAQRCNEKRNCGMQCNARVRPQLIQGSRIIAVPKQSDEPERTCQQTETTRRSAADLRTCVHLRECWSEDSEPHA